MSQWRRRTTPHSKQAGREHTQRSTTSGSRRGWTVVVFPSTAARPIDWVAYHSFTCSSRGVSAARLAVLRPSPSLPVLPPVPAFSSFVGSSIHVRYRYRLHFAYRPHTKLTFGNDHQRTVYVRTWYIHTIHSIPAASTGNSTRTVSVQTNC